MIILKSSNVQKSTLFWPWPSGGNVVICQHSLKKRNLTEMKLSFDQYFLGGAGKMFRFIKPYKKKSHEVKFGERGGQVTIASSASDARPIQRRGRRSFKTALSSRELFEDLSLNVCILKIMIDKVHEFF